MKGRHGQVRHIARRAAASYKRTNHLTGMSLARFVACPDCGAPAGEACTTKHSHHLSRQRVGRRECIAAHGLAERWRRQRDGLTELALPEPTGVSGGGNTTAPEAPVEDGLQQPLPVGVPGGAGTGPSTVPAPAEGRQR